MAEVSAGWSTGLEDLYRDRRVALTRMAYLIIGDAEVAEELVHDAFMAVQPRWDEIEFPAAYLRAAVVNRCRTWARREHLERDHRVFAPQPLELGADEMWDALGHLDDRQRIAIVLRFYEDLPDDDIAEILGCARPTVRSLVRRGLQRLRQEIEQ